MSLEEEGIGGYKLMEEEIDELLEKVKRKAGAPSHRQLAECPDDRTVELDAGFVDGAFELAGCTTINIDDARSCKTS